MKKITCLILACVLFLCGCNKNNDDIVVIGERMFATQITSIRMNQRDYIGRIIQLEGIFESSMFGDHSLQVVYRRLMSDGCCAEDTVGFEVVWDGVYPQSNSWVEAVGVLETFRRDGQNYLRLNLKSLNVLPVRGREFVTR
jgi:hypothetical protein